jgi:hypothetical protein
MTESELFRRLKRIRGDIPAQTYRTIKGQIIAGDYMGADRGIKRLERKMAADGEVDISQQ